MPMPPTENGARLLSSLAREPMAQFFVIGALLFAGYRWWGPEPERAVSIRAATVEALAADQKKLLGRTPTEEELSAAVQGLVREEVLYREALALGLDKGDIIVRRRLIQKMEFLTEAIERIPEPSDPELQTYLDAHAERYRAPARISFRHVFVDRGRHAEPLRKAETIGSRLRSGTEASRVGDPFLRGERFQNRSASQVADVFGPQFAEKIFSLRGGGWDGPVASAFGWHWVYVEELVAERAAELKEVRDQVRNDWFRERQAQNDRAAVARILAGYTIRIEGRKAESSIQASVVP